MMEPLSVAVYLIRALGKAHMISTKAQKQQVVIMQLLPKYFKTSLSLSLSLSLSADLVSEQKGQEEAKEEASHRGGEDEM